MALIYLDKISKKYELKNKTIHKQLLVSCVLATKYLDDSAY